MQIVGTKGRSRSRSRSTPRPTSRAAFFVDDGSDLGAGSKIAVEEIPPCNQYTLQGDLFAGAIRSGTKLPFPLEL